MNGWRNRQTWVLNVHGFFYKAFEGCTFDSVDDLANAMENMFNEFLEENEPKNILIRDLILKSDIDFLRLAEHYAADNEDVIRTEPADEDDDEETDDDDDDEGRDEDADEWYRR